ncbi:hypothetical protein Pla108_17180 [Botrimarina colliarenosi]|uniref:Uncharacterized protein n=1 Tax=Botrimarina colliarenosi TaxID=2528001 RepID=A0A5C6ADT0_9BACT|nr:hypothetical protein [Botrimarina colliarenosi]TWT97566.1 hypothetical protein Pla108_17180 [Botrimarina colliarenosi]
MRKDTQRLAAWADGKPLGVTLPAILAASSTEEIRQFLHQRRTHSGIFASRPAIDEPLRLRFYRSSKALQRRLLIELGVPEDAALGDIYGALQNPNRAEPWAVSCAFVAIVSAFFEPDPEHHAELIEDSLAYAEQDDGPLDLEQPATAFYFWVYLPCWLVYGVTPTELLRRVSKGGKAAEQAARQLVRLDPTAMRTPQVQRWAHSDGARGGYRFKRLRKWAAQAPFDKEKAPSQALKIVAARLSYLSELLDQRLKIPDLRALFAGCQQPADSQAYLTNSTDDDFGRATRRRRQQFGKLPKPDRSAYATVRELLG